MSGDGLVLLSLGMCITWSQGVLHLFHRLWQLRDKIATFFFLLTKNWGDTQCPFSLNSIHFTGHRRPTVLTAAGFPKLEKRCSRNTTDTSIVLLLSTGQLPGQTHGRNNTEAFTHMLPIWLFCWWWFCCSCCYFDGLF